MAREFVVMAGYEQDFAIVFGPEGIWCDLLRSCSKGYAATEMQVVAPEDRRYQVRDYWSSHWEFEGFRERHQREIEQFRKWFAGKGLVEHETWLGSFYRDDSDWDENAGLVSA